MEASNRKYGSATFDVNGNVIGLHGKVAIGDKVVWLGRKVGSCSNDNQFIAGEPYTVAAIYPSNFDLVLQGEKDEHTTRAGESEYKLISEE